MHQGFIQKGALEFLPPLTENLKIFIVSVCACAANSCMTLWQCPTNFFPTPTKKILYETLCMYVLYEYYMGCIYLNIPKSLSMIATVAKSCPETGSAFAVLSVMVKKSLPSTTSSSIIPIEKLCVLPASFQDQITGLRTRHWGASRLVLGWSVVSLLYTFVSWIH